MMATAPTSNAERVNGLVTSVVVEDAGEGGGHGDERKVPVGVGELTEPMARGYILGLDVNQDPGGNIDKESGTIWHINNTMAHHHSVLIIQSDLGDYKDNGLSFFLISRHDLFIVFSQ